MADFLIIDGRHLLWRSHDVFRSLSVEIDDKEIVTGGIYGFLSILIRIHQKYGGQVLVAWEGKNNFRYKLYPDYKKREKPDEEKLLLLQELSEQEFRIKGLLRNIGVKQYFGIRCEADDVIGKLSTTISAANKSVVIYSGDSDLRQLINENIFVSAPGYKGKTILYDCEKVFEKHGVNPKQISDLKALAGDSSDNIPGVKSIGEKTASKLLNTYNDLNGVIKAAKADGYWAKETWPVAERFKKLIVDNEKNVLLFKKLTKINTSVDTKLIKPKKSQKKVLIHLRVYKFRSLSSPVELKQLMAMGKNDG